ncbi:SusD family outer membrane lipoprotein NanU [Niabella beijingensis]|uniref:SusD family outer membrane lipoprotein NanU n=1 Tax=Niabella beijingensis TaxID=2872700 RepID=UPI001CBE4EA5|nr:SusD family outer membrane lipoprotein NanU [Niabella beijingensis]MBZ4191383.1 SusD family outer membrane lipoprotein NanU [Niabella beijingensis]
MKKNILSVIGACFVLIAFNACNKKLELSPVSSYSDASFWKSPDQVDVFVSGIHINLRATTTQLVTLGEMRADIFGTDPGSGASFTGESSQGLERLWTNNLDLDNPGVSGYGNFYFNINQINLLISKIETVPSMVPATKQYYLGIAYGMRAFYYFHLLRSWGKVIIQTEPTVNINISELAKAASGEDSVMALIKSDIESSLSSYGTDYSFKNDKGLWSKAATLMLKAEVYLWTSHRGGGTTDATTAKNALSEIQTNIPALALLPNYANVFASSNKANSEIIFALKNKLDEAQLPFANTFFPQSGLLANFYDSLGNRKFNVTTDNWGGLLRAPTKMAAYRAFSNQDSRKWASIQGGYNLVGGVYQLAGAFANKYQGEQNAGVRQFTNDFPIYRYADLLLLLAEAKVALGENPATEINTVRSRAFGANYNAGTTGYPNQPVDADPRESILQERFYEFILEGKRWYDLRRMGDAYVYAYTNIASTESYKLLWPVDRNTLTNNRLLTQTPGYSQY